MFGLLELSVLALAVVVAWLFRPSSSLLRVERVVKALSNRPLLVVAIPGILTISGRLALLSVSPAPVPGVHDEFSYLLAADTFAHGRMTNPTNPMWTHLETFHELQQPSYASMYPVGQGLFLAAGELLGSPWIGVLLSVALMCSAITWMLCGCYPASWALVGGLLAVCRFGLFSYWVDSYWGGAVAALGGALVFGSAIRLLGVLNSVKRMAALLLSFTFGLLLLANTRPFEGLMFSLPVLVVLLRRLLTASPKWPAKWLLKASIPSIATAASVVALMGAYFWHVTGSPIVMPYQLHQQQYSTTQPFIWQPMLPEPHYRHVVFQHYYEPQAAFFRQAHTLSGWAHETLLKSISIVMFYLWPMGLIILLMFRSLWLTDRFFRLAIWTCLATFAGLSLEIWPMMLHYAAPLTSVAILISVAALRSLRRITWKGRQAGFYLSWALPLMCLAMLTLRASAAALHIAVPDQGMLPWFTIRRGNVERLRVEHRLEQIPGKHLVVVRYGSHHNPSNEWVYNPALIGSAKVVWARGMTPAEDAGLIHYFSDREVWLLEPDKNPVRLVPYNSFSLSSSSNR